MDVDLTGVGFVEVQTAGGATFLAPWDVVTIEQQTRPDCCTVRLAKQGANLAIGVVGESAGQVAAKVWGKVERFAAIAMLQETRTRSLDDLVAAVAKFTMQKMEARLAELSARGAGVSQAEVRDLVAMYLREIAGGPEDDVESPENRGSDEPQLETDDAQEAETGSTAAGKGKKRAAVLR